MKLAAWLVSLTLVLVVPATAATPVVRTFAAPIDRVWSVTEAVLKHQGWDIDKADRSVGLLTTESRRVDGENYGVYEKGIRHRLHLQFKASGARQTTVTVQRTIFKRERIMFVDNDEVLSTTDQSVERALLDSIAKAL
jgi:hypothetical protein